MRNPHACRYRGPIVEPESEAGWFLLTDEPAGAKLMIFGTNLMIIAPVNFMVITEVDTVHSQHVYALFVRVTPAMLWLNAIQFQLYCSELGASPAPSTQEHFYSDCSEHGASPAPSAQEQIHYRQFYYD